MTIPLQFAFLYDGQVFVRSDCLLDLGTDFLVSQKISFRADVSCEEFGYAYTALQKYPEYSFALTAGATVVRNRRCTKVAR